MTENELQKKLSDYFSLRYIETDREYHRDADIVINSVYELDEYLKKTISEIDFSDKAILLSGGMDSALVASYVPEGTLAYTFNYGYNFATEEYNRAVDFAKKNNLTLKNVDITWASIKDSIDLLIKNRKAPISTIEPQIYLACEYAKRDGVTCLLHGGDSDVVFGGLSKILSKDWKKEEFIEFYSFSNPVDYLVNPDLSYRDLFNTFEDDKGYINCKKFIDVINETETSIAFENSFNASNMKWIDPFSKLFCDYDINLIRKKPKYIVQDLFYERYGFYPHEKNPMPRPVDFYEELNVYPKSDFFRKDIDFTKLNGQQKWMIFCADKYLELFYGK